MYLIQIAQKQIKMVETTETSQPGLFDELVKIVGGWIETNPPLESDLNQRLKGFKAVVAADEEGLLKNKPHNVLGLVGDIAVIKSVYDAESEEYSFATFTKDEAQQVCLALANMI